MSVDVLFEVPDGPPVEDGDGGFTQNYKTIQDLQGNDVPVWWMSIKPASTRDLDRLERLGPGTSVATTILIAKGHYLPTVTTQARMRWTDTFGLPHLGQVSGIGNPDGRGIEMQIVLVEVI